MVAVMGDIHGVLTPIFNLVNKLKRGDTIIQVGDFGVGFEPETEEKNFKILDAFLQECGIELLAIRGNHDDPEYFTVERLDTWENIKFLPDYSVRNIEGKEYLFVGGASSIDRYYRTEGVDWWRNEYFVFNESMVPNKKIDIVITHSAPDFCAPTEKFEVPKSFLPTRIWGSDSEFLLNKSIEIEREDHTKLYDEVTKNGKIEKWFYGHFHKSANESIKGTNFVLLSINETYEIR